MKAKDSAVVDILAKVAYEILEHKVSIDVAFKRICKHRICRSLPDRERIYELAWSFISDYIKLRCLNRRKSLKSLARIWLEGKYVEPDEEYCKLSYQKWFYDRLVKLLGRDQAHLLLREMNRRHWWLRVNTLKCSCEKAVKMLENEGAEYTVDEDFHYLIKVTKTPRPIRLLKPVREFCLIPQDKASITVVESLNPEPGDLILDMAAAPGMKTSLIFMLTENNVRVTALDISLKRIRIMKSLMKKLGVDVERLNIVSADSKRIHFRSNFNKVLLDAPCSNSGALSKDPGLKLTLKQSKLDYYSSIQKLLLSKAIELGDKVIYSTCSLFPEEGEEIISHLYLEGLIKVYRPFQWTSYGYEGYDVSRYVMRLFPHIHNSEGFFIASIKPLI